jgi:hypothetical protein
MLPASECSEQPSLRERYNLAVRAYRQKIAILNGALTNAEFEDAYERAESERLIFVHARFYLRYHIQEHGCAVAADTASMS